MTSQTLEPRALDLSGTPAIPFGRLVSVETRKMVDTRAGRWLLISTGLVTALVLVIQLWVVVAQDLHVSFSDFMIGMNTPMGIFLPVLGIMSVTQEFGQRTALTTFTQVPSRLTVYAAKFVATLALAVAAVVIGLLLASVANVLYGALSGNDVTWAVGVGDIGRYFLLHVLGLATGFAFGTLFLNTAVAIVVYFVYSFVLPPLFGIGAALVGWINDLQPWVDFSAAQEPLVDGGVSGSDWAHLAVAGVIWLVLPLVVGLWRVLRAEIK
ncbi:ABC transporter permease [Nocardioides sp.]|uniref:ABC transporter permease n=1 Tax=Nocardioides sp. TaxID=35761 RepID=UPI00352831A1